METEEREKIRSIWRQNTVPVIYRRGPGYTLLIRLPYKEDNRVWLKNERRNDPKWEADKKHWEIPQAWFNDTVNRMLRRFGKLYIIQPHRKQEKCAPACWNAVGHECQCSCLGENHGSENPEGKWFIVSDTFAAKLDTKELACRLLIRR